MNLFPRRLRGIGEDSEQGYFEHVKEKIKTWDTRRIKTWE